IVGNTCMHHLFLGISPDSLVHAPYVPAVKEGMIITPEKAGLKMNPSGRVLILPNIAGFVGADTVGCMLSVAFDQLDKMTLMLDIGTNGELVMGNKKKMVTTSTAAGPAFEGAKIECGMRGSRGAVSHLKTEDGRLSLEVVDHAKPIGICGSGLIDILAFLIRYGFIDSYGGFCDVDELEDPLAKTESWRLQEIDGKPAFVLFPAEETGNGSPVYISQKDIREVQLAKGAIAAGIQIMTEKLGICPEDIQQVFLAGAFGNYMDAGNACEIGLIPYELRDRIIPIGNAAGEGAKLACLNQGEYRYACKMAEGAEFIELATESEFQDVFVDKLEFSRAVER
ncbi:MAG TPA: ferredoxin, partial [Lachnospiraceae bacterium]|nr:ferredoxin [Lachnospiraceae bacterium]